MAGRIRTIKPDLLDQERYAQLSDAAVRLFTGCLALVDDAGVCPAGPTYLGGRIFYARPRSAISIGKLLGELERARLVDLFVVDRAQYLAIVGWSEKGAPTYQRIDKPQASKFPAPTSVRSWNAGDAGSDPIRSDQIREREPSRAIGQAGGEPWRAVPAPSVPAVSLPPPPREDIPRTLPQPPARAALPALPAAPASAFDPESPADRGRLAIATYQRVSDARVQIAAELGLADQLPFPAIVPSSRAVGGAGSFRDLQERIREEGSAAPAVCERVVENLIAQAREDRSIEWVAEKAFTAGGWRTARGWLSKKPKPKVRAIAAPAEEHHATVEPLTDEDRAEIAELARKVGAGRADAAAAEERARRAPRSATTTETERRKAST